MTPQERLASVCRDMPRIGDWIDCMRAGRGRDLPQWPEWCLMPLAGWYSMLSRTLGVERLDAAQAGRLAEIAALGTWRYSQGIYRFDDTLRGALAECPAYRKWKRHDLRIRPRINWKAGPHT